MRTELCADTADADDFAALRAACGLPPLEHLMLELCLEGSLFTLLAVARDTGGDQPVGMLRVVGDGVFVFHIYDVMVAPAFRGQGIGRWLVRAAVDRIKGMVPPGRWVTVNLLSAAGREGFYRKLGFSALPNEHFGAGMQLIEKS